jgi:hypothetical protein
MFTPSFREEIFVLFDCSDDELNGEEDQKHYGIGGEICLAPGTFINSNFRKCDFLNECGEQKQM